MYVIHGTWIPEETNEYINKGKFSLWIETDEIKSQQKFKNIHPSHLSKQKLNQFFTEVFQISSILKEQFKRNEELKYFILPSQKNIPLFSFELLRYQSKNIPSDFEWKLWGINCINISDPLMVLKDFHFLSLYYPDRIMLGNDFLFWYQYSRALSVILIKDQYIPALKCCLEKSSSKKKKKSYNFYPGWEIISYQYEKLVDNYCSIMPPICRVGQNSKDEKPECYESKTLLRQFSEQLIEEIITNTTFTQKIINQVSNTFIEGSISPVPNKNEYLWDHENKIELWKKWYTWKKHLDGYSEKSLFNTCFRLESADKENPDNWKMVFLAESKNDPSLKIELSDYWNLANKTSAYDFIGDDFHREILIKLGHAARIYPKIWEGLETDKPSYVLLSLEEAFEFLKDSAWVLKDAGYKIIVPSWWTPEGRRRIKIRLKTSSKVPKQELSQNYFSIPSLIQYQYKLSIGGKPVTEAEWQALVNAKTPLVHFRGEWIELDQKKMAMMLDFWKKNNQEQSDISLMELLRKSGENEDDFDFSYDNTLEELINRLLTKRKLNLIKELKGFKGNLREYQKRGTSWLYFLESIGLNPCLADDMGLGKTIEVIALLLYERQFKEIKNPILLIVPTSVIGNWQKEIERFSQGFSVLIHHGSNRTKNIDDFKLIISKYNIIITSFALVRKDEKLFKEISWHRIVVDEAQNIKNPKSTQTKIITKLKANYKIALTGTPIENRLLDLWSIFNFLNPGYLYTMAKFRKYYEIPIQKENDIQKSLILKKLVEPFILRRVKTDKEIIKDLPDKVEQKVYCNLTKEQASLYQTVVDEVSKAIEEKEGIERKGLILSTLMRLKQVCNHPTQFLQDGSPFTKERSHKLSRLSDMITEVLQNEENLLIFSQFKEIGSLLESYLKTEYHFNTYFLHGGTPRKKREQMIVDFQNPDTDPSVFILSLKAGGVGITLTKANHVFHFDRWWNPAVENQATDRAFRIGQKKNVFVHKFISIGTLEERIDQMLEDKKKLSDSIISSDESWLSKLDNETFKNLIKLGKTAILE